MGAQTASFVARETRYRVVAAGAVHVEVEPESDGPAAQRTAELLDISSGGVRVGCDTPLADGSGLTIAVTAGEPAAPITVCAVVIWTTPAPRGRFYCGCSIEPLIPPGLLDHLAAAGILERRQEVRQQTSVTLPARWELDRVDQEAAILNISTGGISLLMPQPGRVGQRLCLHVLDEKQRPANVYVKARWQINTDSGSVVGCEIHDRLTYLRLAQAVNKEPSFA